MKVLVTGIAGFIGMHVGSRLLDIGHNVIGIDNLNDYYDINLKKARLKELTLKKKKFKFIKLDISNRKKIEALFLKERFEIVINLAAQAGVRFSVESPYDYINSNVNGFLNLLEGARKVEVLNFIYASSSSVYGLNGNIPFNEDSSADHPKSLYGATKKSNELMAHSYASLYNIPLTGLRFFTVYGPWGRPDMALFLFTKAIISNLPINVYNKGNMKRDFTYIDDVVEVIIRLTDKPATPSKIFNKLNPQSSLSDAPHRIFNVGNNKPISLKKYILHLENIIGRSAIKNLLPMQLGDVKSTSSDNLAIQKWVGYKPNTDINVGIKKFVTWYRNFYRV
ncbi:NAD-dependent epimerase/dehydratase family protein [Alphaproteobacteria bacterium]|nr:NAD-dependent epimerase/dehydratase family protein [Alphaproteobacteria bacterium]